MKNKISWLALLFAAAALLISFVFIGQAQDTSGEFEQVIEDWNFAIDALDEIGEEYNEVIADYNRIAEAYDLIIEDYWEWRAEQDATGSNE